MVLTCIYYIHHNMCLLSMNIKVHTVLGFFTAKHTVQLKCNIACAREQLEGSTRVTLLQHASILNPTRKSLGFNMRECLGYSRVQ